MFNTFMLERVKTQVLASRRERVERYVAAFERQPAILKPVDLHCCRIVSPVGLSLASIGFVLALINRKDYGPVFLIGLERVTGSGVQAVIIHVLDAETLCDRIRKADNHALVINAKLNLARPVVCIGAHRFKKRRRNAFLVFDCRALSNNHMHNLFVSYYS